MTAAVNYDVQELVNCVIGLSAAVVVLGLVLMAHIFGGRHHD